MFLLEHQQQAHLDAALRRDAVETVLVEAKALACVQLIILLDLLHFWISKIFEKIIGTSPKNPYKTKKTTNRLSQRFIVLLVRSRELESLAL